MSRNAITDDVATTWGASILYYPIQLMMGIVTEVLEAISAAIASKSNVTPEDVLFNNVPLVDINFFSQNSSESFVTTIRGSVASWYYGIRNIAIVASLCVLIYIGIRMAISSAADEKARYKEMFKDWVVSFALVFVLHYIMMLILYGNNAIVDVFKTALSTAQTNGSTMGEYFQSLKEVRYTLDVSVPVVQKFGANAVCLLLAGLTIIFLIMYIKRFIVIAFLIMIAPLITITYAIDKVGDGKSQALNTWLKEFFWTVVIQPFHCLIYLVFVTISIGLVQTGNFASSMLAIFCMIFILQAEDIVKKIFSIQADDVGKLSATSALVAGGAVAALGKLKNDKKKGQADEQDNKNPKDKSPKLPQSRNGAEGRSKDNVNNQSDFNVKPINAEYTESNNKVTTKDDQIGKPVQDSPRVQGAMDKFSGVIDGIKDSKASGLAKKYMQFATGVSMGLLAQLSDKPGVDKFIGGFAAGSIGMGKMYDGVGRLGEKGVNSLSNKLDAVRTTNMETNVDKAYDNYKEKIEHNPDKIRQKAMDLIEIEDTSKITNNVERQFAEKLQDLYAQYEKTGHQDPMVAVITRLHLREEQKK